MAIGPEAPLVGAAIVVATGLAVRVLGMPELISGTRPVVGPELATDFVGNFTVAVGVCLGILGILNRTVGVPEVAWLVFGAGIVLAVAATPKLAGWYVRWRTTQSENI